MPNTFYKLFIRITDDVEQTGMGVPETCDAGRNTTFI